MPRPTRTTPARPESAARRARLRAHEALGGAAEPTIDQENETMLARYAQDSSMLGARVVGVEHEIDPQSLEIDRGARLDMVATEAHTAAAPDERPRRRPRRRQSLAGETITSGAVEVAVDRLIGSIGTDVREIALDEIDVPVAGCASDALIESIRRHGMLSPVIVEQRARAITGPQRHRIVQGRRRIDAARRLGCTHVAARLLPLHMDAEAYADLVIGEHMTRSRNILAEADALSMFIAREGCSEVEAARRLRLEPTVVRRLVSLADLTHGMRAAVLAGRVPSSVAVRIAQTCDADVQTQLLASVPPEASFTLRHVREALHEQQAQQATLPLTGADVLTLVGTMRENVLEIDIDVIVENARTLTIGTQRVRARRVVAPETMPSAHANDTMSAQAREGSWQRTLEYLLICEESFPIGNDFADEFFAEIARLRERATIAARAAGEQV